MIDNGEIAKAIFAIRSVISTSLVSSGIGDVISATVNIFLALVGTYVFKRNISLLINSILKGGSTVKLQYYAYVTARG